MAERLRNEPPGKQHENKGQRLSRWRILSASWEARNFAAASCFNAKKSGSWKASSPERARELGSEGAGAAGSADGSSFGGLGGGGGFGGRFVCQSGSPCLYNECGSA
eukprot:14457741-Alexandrium_andersonii.AAC.1